MAGQTIGAETQLKIGSNKICFVSIEDKTVFGLTDGSSDAICGSHYVRADRFSTGPITPKLHILMHPTPEEFDALLPLLGFSESTDVFTLVEDFSSLTGFDVLLARGASVDLYENGIVDKAILRFQKGGKPWALELQVYFQNMQINSAGTFSGSEISGTAPYAFTAGVLNANSISGVPFQSGLLMIDYNVNVQHNNSILPTSIIPGVVKIHLGVDTPYTSDEVTLLTAFTSESDPPVPVATGYSGSVVFTRGGLSCTLALTNLKSEATPPSIKNRSEEVRLKMFYEVLGTSSTKPLVITNDITA